MKKSIIFLWIAILLLGFACKKKSIGPIVEKPTFTIYGAVVKDLNLSKDIAVFTVSRNDTLYDDATVKVGNKSIPNVGSGLYYMEFSDTTFHMNTAYTDSIISPTDTVTITFNFTMPDTFSVNVTPTRDTFRTINLPILTNWTASGNSNGYIVSVVKGDTISGAELYNATDDASPNPIPNQAFYTSGMGTLVLGYYWIYVIAYNKSFPTYPGIPFNLPAGLPANNISGAQGTIGAGVIAQKVVIYVATL
ncbi:MAG TPA: hypothetical protein VMT04_05850 [Terriglobales bacterium]|nr:hypothetical protein [Terriglobales bacterium]